MLLEPSTFYNFWVRFGTLYIHNYLNFLIASYKIPTAMVFCAAVGCSELVVVNLESVKTSVSTAYLMIKHSKQNGYRNWRETVFHQKKVSVCHPHIGCTCFKRHLSVFNNLLWRFLMAVSFVYFVMSCKKSESWKYFFTKLPALHRSQEMQYILMEA